VKLIYLKSEKEYKKETTENVNKNTPTEEKYKKKI
jgi:hypothetical protein